MGAVNMIGAFYSADLGIPEDAGKKIGCFMLLASTIPCVISASPWVKHGVTRVYIELWSQNKLPPIESIDKAYYDADENEVYVTQYRCGVAQKTRLCDLPIYKAGCGSMFSGARTRAALGDLAEKFYAEKETWD